MRDVHLVWSLHRVAPSWLMGRSQFRALQHDSYLTSYTIKIEQRISKLSAIQGVVGTVTISERDQGDSFGQVY
jgi:hypothetical protein